VKTEKLLAVVLEQEEDNDLLVYCMSKSAMDIFSKRTDEGYYSSLIGRYFMDSGKKHREYFGVSKDIFQPIHFVI
jgi:hypothetical protein